jgi:hypothetical protein
MPAAYYQAYGVGYRRSEKGQAAKRREVKKRQAAGDLCKAAAIELKGGKCEGCGFQHQGALQFHHRVPGTKLAGIGHMIQKHPGTYSVTDIFEELEKCDLLCSNCHDVLHWEEHRR